jgi:hypothetical protein
MCKVLCSDVQLFLFWALPLRGRAIRYKSSLRCGLSTAIPNAGWLNCEEVIGDQLF